MGTLSHDTHGRLQRQKRRLRTRRRRDRRRLRDRALPFQRGQRRKEPVHPVVERGFLLEDMRDLDELERRLLPEVDLALKECLEGAVALREVELLLLDLGQNLADLEEALLETFTQRP